MEFVPDAVPSETEVLNSLDSPCTSVTMEELQSDPDEMDHSDQTTYHENGPAEITSLHLNDYCGPILSVSDKLNKLTQTTECLLLEEPEKVTFSVEKSTQITICAQL